MSSVKDIAFLCRKRCPIHNRNILDNVNFIFFFKMNTIKSEHIHLLHFNLFRYCCQVQAHTLHGNQFCLTSLKILFSFNKQSSIILEIAFLVLVCCLKSLMRLIAAFLAILRFCCTFLSSTRHQSSSK